MAQTVRDRAGAPWRCHKAAYAFICGLLALVLQAAQVQAAPLVRSGAPKPWIQTLAVPEAEGGSCILLNDRQVLIGARDVQSYSRWVQAIGDESTLDSAAQVAIEFDADETLVLHHVRVQRAGVTTDRLVLADVRLAQREHRLEQQIYDGRQTAILFVPDLRVGDVLDYAYTVQSRSAQPGEKYYGQFALGMSTPVARLHLRIVAPSARRLSDVWHGPSGSDAPASQQLVHDGHTEYVWDLRSTPTYPIEPNTPDWYNPVPWVQLTEFASWAEVAEWGGRVVSTTADRDPAILDFLSELPAGTLEQHLLQVVRFVQDDVRYVGIETGLSRTQAAPPATVLARRFGDCKDKSGLLIALLRGLGVQASPMLVSSRFRDRLYAWAPSPGAFDHVIVMVEAAGGPYWIDSTAALQGGGLARLRYSNVERGLIVRADTTQLTAARQRPHTHPPRREIVERFTLSDPELADDATLDAERLYTDDEAEQLRVLLRSLGADQIAKILLEELQQDYPAARETAPATWHDDREANTISIHLYYRVPRLWSACNSGELCSARVVARPVADALPPELPAGRRAPLALHYPVLLRYFAELDLPFEVRDTSLPVRVQGPAFDFAFEPRRDGNKLTYAYGLQMSSDELSVSKLAEHRRALELAEPQLVRAVERRRPIADGILWPMVVLVVAVAGASAFAARFYLRQQRRAAANTSAHGDAWHLGGWLVILGVVLIAHPISNIIATLPVARLLFSRASWDELTHLDGDLGQAGLSLGVLLLTTSTTVVCSALVPPFILRRREFRAGFTVLTATSFVLSLLTIALYMRTSGMQLPAGTSWTEHALNFVVSAMWIAYVRFSKRSNATFVR
jgi:transglutaminase-like putative cysteine protease